ncbi:MAG: hypothetical protein WCJ30_03970 [Deltaproteobacteria bacterium]
MSVAVGLAVCALAIGAMWLAGLCVSHLLGVRDEDLPPGAHALLGLAATLLAVDCFTVFWPVRLTAYVAAPLVAFGSVVAYRRARASFASAGVIATVRPHLPAFVALTVAFVLGAWPLFVAHRVAVATLTNDDATFYIDATDHILRVSWLTDLPEPDGCLSNMILHVWHWRMGVPLIMALLSVVTGLDPTQTMALTPPILHALVPVGAWWLLDAMGVARTPRITLTTGLLSALSASALFVGYQDMTSHQGSLAVFSAAIAAMALAAREGGARRVLLAALPLALGVLLFADGASVLLLLTIATAISCRATFARSLGRIVAVWLSAGALAIPSFVRAALALYGTLAYRVTGAERIFPNRGWLRRSLLDDLGTTVGIDPWPPWPAPWPLDLLGCATLAGLLGAVTLAALAGNTLRRSSLARALIPTVVLALVASRLWGAGGYILVKATVSASAFVLPCLALGASAPRWRVAAAPAALYTVGLASALGFMAAPAQFTARDSGEVSHFVAVLRGLPAGSVVVLDGFGAPADLLHDTQRAYRAALRAGHIPVRLGLDGGFYTHCPVTPRIAEARPLFALERRTGEVLSSGTEIERFGSYRLVRAARDRADQFVAAWAPMVGWLRVERERDGTVFRWGEREARGLLRVEGGASCIRLRGEVRTIDTAGSLDVNVFDRVVATVALRPRWTPFETQIVTTPSTEQATVFTAHVPASAGPADHIFALRYLAVAPAPSCGVFSTTTDARTPVTFPITLDAPVTLGFETPANFHCARVVATVSHGAGRLGLRATREAAMTWTTVHAGTSVARSEVTPLDRERVVHIAREADGGAPPWRIDNLALEPMRCLSDINRARAATR